MKKLTLLALLLISATSFAQSRFIEVEVTDTISLKPLSFQVNVYEDLTAQLRLDENEDYDPMAVQEKSKNKLQQVKTMLESNKYKVGPLDNSKLGILQKRATNEEGFTVMVNELADVKKLEAFLQPEEEIQTIVTVLKYADEQKAEDLLIKKLVDKAKARALVIGNVSGLKVGRIHEVRETRPTDAVSGMADMYAQILKMGMTGDGGGDHTGSMSKTFVIKFAAE